MSSPSKVPRRKSGSMARTVRLSVHRIATHKHFLAGSIRYSESKRGARADPSRFVLPLAGCTADLVYALTGTYLSATTATKNLNPSQICRVERPYSARALARRQPSSSQRPGFGLVCRRGARGRRGRRQIEGRQPVHDPGQPRSERLPAQDRDPRQGLRLAPWRRLSTIADRSLSVRLAASAGAVE